MAKLTESQAWALLAAAWAKAGPDGSGRYRALCELGLCSCLDDLCIDERISDSTFQSMKNAIPPGTTGLNMSFCWSHNAAGAASRAAFCRKMAKQTAPKKRVKAKRVKAKA